jgi:hypothetical protein
MVAERWETLIQKESERQSELRTFMSRGSRDSAHWKWERIRVASRTRSAPLLSLVAHHVQKKVRMGPGVPDGIEPPTVSQVWSPLKYQPVRLVIGYCALAAPRVALLLLVERYITK